MARWAFEHGDFEKALELIRKTPKEERTLAEQYMRLIMKIPEPLARRISWYGPKAGRRLSRFVRRR